MPNLIVRNLEPELVEALKQRALKNGRSAEMEHRAILREVLLAVKKRSFLDALMAMPTIGDDQDFSRIQNQQQVSDVFV
jgi:plasmid stability protein